MPISGDVDSLNKEFYLNQTAASWYATKEFVLPEEQAFLRDFGAELKGAAILDIGIGAGRSTRFLLPLSANYIGVDYSPDMVREAAAHFPGTRMEVCDARDLSAYGAGSFDFVMFSFNGMDCLSHEGRLLALAEMRRVLKPGGLLAFSHHNRDRAGVKPYALSNLNRSKHPLRLLRNVGEYLDGIRNWRRSLHCALETEEYALRHDSGNFFTVPMYYITKQAQVAQLERLGFEVLKIYNSKGETTRADEPDAASSLIFHACRKPA